MREATLMTIYEDYPGAQPYEVDVVMLDCGAGRLKCDDCDGLGRFATVIDGAEVDDVCNRCKGAGAWLVSVA